MPQPELPSERMCQVEHRNDISNSHYTEREANTSPIQLQICYSLVQPYFCASNGSLAVAGFTSGLFLRLLCLSLPFPPPSPLGYLAKGLLAVL